MLAIIQLVLVCFLIYVLYYWIHDLKAKKGSWGNGNLLVSGLIGLITDFLDTLGIGCFATTTLLFNITKYLDTDKDLPGTLNVGHAVPVLVEAFIFIQVVEVDPLTLILLVGAAIVGSVVFSRVVGKFSENKIQVVMGIALLITAVLMALRQLGYLDLLGQGNEATGLTGMALVIGIIGNCILGALMTVGVGLYAPCMAMVYLLGLNPLVAFPIMMASCAGLMPPAGVEFIKQGNYSRKGAIGLTIGGIIGVVIAAYFVTSLNLDVLIWIIVIVVVYTAIMMLRKGIKGMQTA
ncbi:MAG: permease [Tetragenococcus koreensis]|uniref:TSUP family transporter n=1 Tax=Tetragenococcus halophilus TaxID=51669 RepID=UPI001F177336|nr:TSUP family transporter [Tetragenococcus halophilus]MDN6139617.1 permease [Tetragenococcus koreensis]MDN6611642.1 permease [Staphylococcus equorum]MCF1675827.1 permease [Tetragenococcus halophilus]MDN6166238.1 permease [Tetragenococcus koreensis]MDN6541049.1 permease [Tetragenococcus koreensis]